MTELERLQYRVHGDLALVVFFFDCVDYEL